MRPSCLVDVGFGPRAMAKDDFDFPASPDFEFPIRDSISDYSSRVDFAPSAAGPFRRVWGHVGQISESRNAANKTTGFKFDVVCKFPYRIKDFGKRKLMRAGFSPGSWRIFPMP